VRSTKKIWTKPELSRFDSLEELVASFGARATETDLENLREMAAQMEEVRENSWLPRQKKLARR
jgi:hypothetical protein